MFAIDLSDIPELKLCDMVPVPASGMCRCKACGREITFHDFGMYGSPMCDGPVENVKPRQRCYQCDVGMCAELDSYYGRDHEQAKRCSKCRR